MLKSMTGFGRGNFNGEKLNVAVEVKSVNHRYFEFSCRVPRAYQFLEETLKSLCQQSISRGKTEVSVYIEEIADNSTAVDINYPYVKAYLAAAKKLSKEFKLKCDIKVSDLALNQEVFRLKKIALDDETVTEAVTKAMQDALESFVKMREIEGARLKEDVISKANGILSMVEAVEKRSPETLKAYREKLEQKMRELLDNVQIDEQRLITETAVFADKIAVDEETVRLRSHIKQLGELCESSEPVGKKLDFLVQEMNRETNTIGSKAQDLEIARIVVDIKSEIEKIREQIQNIE